MPLAMMRRVHGAGAAEMAARLERHVQRGAARALAGLVEREHFGVRFAGPRVPPLADDDAVGDTTTAPTIGFGVVAPAPGPRGTARARM